jgi:hypothetical protein
VVVSGGAGNKEQWNNNVSTYDRIVYVEKRIIEPGLWDVSDTTNRYIYLWKRVMVPVMNRYGTVVKYNESKWVKRSIYVSKPSTLNYIDGYVHIHNIERIIYHTDACLDYNEEYCPYCGDPECEDYCGTDVYCSDDNCFSYHEIETLKTKDYREIGIIVDYRFPIDKTGKPTITEYKIER